MTLKQTLSQYWEKIQGTLFPQLEEGLPPLIQNRKVLAEGGEGKILEILKQNTSQGTFELNRRGREGKSAITYQLQLSWISVEIHPPRYMG